MPVDGSTVVYPGDPVPRFEVHSTIAREGFNLLEIHLGSQSGTHVDAPYHFEPDGLRVDEIPPDRFVGPGVVVDGSGLGARGVIEWEHVAPVADRLGPGVIVLLRTGWGRHYGTRPTSGTPTSGATRASGCWISECARSASRRSTLTRRPTRSTPVSSACHHLISRLDGVIGENFRLDELPDGDFMVVCTPMRLTGADGGPVRAVAIELGP